MLAHVTKASSVAVATITVAALVAGPCAEVYAQDDPVVLIKRSPRGRQYLVVGIETGFWLGSATVSAVEGQELGPELGSFDGTAIAAGPVFVGFNHVVTDRMIFEIRLGAGAVLFDDDRLISRDLENLEKDRHTGLILSAEVLARYVLDAGVTFGFGANLASVGLAEETGATLRISPRLGYQLWNDRYNGYWLIEAGYQFPLIGSLVPEFQGVREAPIDSSWHMVNISSSWGF